MWPTWLFVFMSLVLPIAQAEDKIIFDWASPAANGRVNLLLVERMDVTVQGVQAVIC